MGSAVGGEQLSRRMNRAVQQFSPSCVFLRIRHYGSLLFFSSGFASRKKEANSLHSGLIADGRAPARNRVTGFWVQHWVQLENEEWLRIFGKRHQIGHLDFCLHRLLTECFMLQVVVLRTTYGQLREGKQRFWSRKRRQIKRLWDLDTWFGTRRSKVQILSPRPLPNQQLTKCKSPLSA